MPTERLEGSITHGRLMFSQTQRIGAFPHGDLLLFSLHIVHC